MSIIFLDDLILNTMEEGHSINNKTCLFFLLLNVLNISCDCLHLFIYYKPPYNKYNFNSFSLILVFINLFSGITFFLFYWELYFKNPIIITSTLKIEAMINPLIIFLFYFWCTCLTHNIYASYYISTNTPKKRIIEYKFKLIIYLFIFFIITILCIKFNENNITSLSFSFINFYRKSYIILCYFAGLIILGYIILELYYIKIKKYESVSLIRQNILSIKELFKSIVFRHILYICYFLIIFVPVNILFILKNISSKLNFQNYYFEFIIMTLISLYGIFIFCVRLTNKNIYNLFLNIILCDKKNQKELEPLLDNKDNINNNSKEKYVEKISVDLDKLTYGNKNMPNEIENKKTTSFKLENTIEMKIIEENLGNLEKNISKAQLKHRKTIKDKNILKNGKSRFLKVNNNLNNNQKNENNPLPSVIESFLEDNDNNKNIDNKYNPLKENVKRIKEETSSKYFSLFSYNLEIYDMLNRMIAISISIDKSRIYENQNIYQDFYISPLPWKNKNHNFYKERTPYENYSIKNIPEWLDIKDEKIFENIQFKILSYSPFVFHHLRVLDKVTIDDILKSLNIKKNLEMIIDSKEILKRGDSSMIISWDKKLVLKTITKNEKNNFINKMLEEYHSRIRDTKSILSHIYGTFKIEIEHRKTYVILQRNMNELFLKSNVLTFELNGLAIDRQRIKPDDINLKQSVLINKYKNIILKENDLKITDIKIELNPYDGGNILLSICNDSMFLQKYNVIDYSLLIFVNKYDKKNFKKHLGNSSIMPDVDKKYIFNFSIVDYLDIFSFEKKSEKLVNDFVGVFKVSLDKNLKLIDPQSYGIEFRKFAKKIIIFDKEDNDKGNFSS